jgi:hypothetical protein
MGQQCTVCELLMRIRTRTHILLVYVTCITNLLLAVILTLELKVHRRTKTPVYIVESKS